MITTNDLAIRYSKISDAVWLTGLHVTEDRLQLQLNKAALFSE